MNRYFDLLASSSLFTEIDRGELPALLGCLGSKKAQYSKNEIIFSAEQEITHIGLLLKGSAYIIQDDFWGNRTIVSPITAGETFGEAFAWGNVQALPVSIVAGEACDVLLMDYDKMAAPCKAVCAFHQQLIRNMLKTMAAKNVLLTKKIGHLTKRTTQEKVLSFLSAQAVEQQRDKFTIPFDRQGLADYLAVDRSALSTTLSKLQRQGVLSFHKNVFELKEKDPF